LHFFFLLEILIVLKLEQAGIPFSAIDCIFYARIRGLLGCGKNVERIFAIPHSKEIPTTTPQDIRLGEFCAGGITVKYWHAVVLREAAKGVRDPYTYSCIC
jgi:hypothetical protein